MRGLACSSVLTLALLSCARLPQESKALPPSALPPGAVQPGAPETPWAKKTRPERMEFMGLVFFPKMKALFQAHDPHGYAQFRCQTCHGEGMEAADFKKPFGLYALPEGDPTKAALAYDEKTARFMADEVVPAARALLGIDHPDGQSCHLCHDSE